MSKQRLVLGLDPGTTKTGWCLYATRYYVANGPCVESCGVDSNPEVLGLMGVLSTSGLRPDLVIIERFSSYGMPIGQTTIDAIDWGGRFAQRCDDLGIPWIRLFRKEVKLRLCGSSRAKDGNIRKRLMDMHRPTGKDGKGRPSPVGTKKHPGPLYGVSKDAWAALALVMAHTRPDEP